MNRVSLRMKLLGWRKSLAFVIGLLALCVMLERKRLKSPDFAFGFGALCGGYFVGMGIEHYGQSRPTLGSQKQGSSGSSA